MSLKRQSKVKKEPCLFVTPKFSWSLRHLTFSTHRSRQVPIFLHCFFSLAISNGAVLTSKPKRYYCCRRRAAPTHPQQLRSKSDFACLKARGSVPFYCNRKRERHVLGFFCLTARLWGFSFLNFYLPTLSSSNNTSQSIRGPAFSYKEKNQGTSTVMLAGISESLLGRL